MIRNLTPKDFDEFCRVRLTSLETYPIAYSSMPKFFIEAPDKMKMALLTDSESDSSNFIKGYFEDDKLVGVIGLRRESRESVNHKASIWGFYVAPKHQGKSIGRKLIEALIQDTLSDLRLKYLRLMTAVSCEKAVSLFNSVGFKQYGLEPASIQFDDVYHDQVYMKLDV